MALDLFQNFVSAQYLENKLTDFTKFSIYALILIRPSLGSVSIGSLPVIFHKFVTKLWRLIGNRILFLLNILRTNG